MLGSAGCSLLAPTGGADSNGAGESFYKHSVSGKLESPGLREASGIAASKCQPDVFWIHNDSGDASLIYAIDSTGKHLGVWNIEGAANRDWEDIATVKSNESCFVLIGEIGDNEHKHQRLAVYRVEEPIVTPEARSSTSKSPLSGPVAEVTYINYPNEKHDSEAMLAHPSNGEVYLLTKANNSPSHIYKLKPKFAGETETLSKVGELTVPSIPNGSITGGDISADGKRVVLCDYFAGYELKLPDGAASFDAIWKQRPERVDLGERVLGEAAAYSADGSFVIAVSEKRHTPVNIARRRSAN